MISDSVLNRYQNNWKIKSDHVKAPHWPDYQAYSSAATLTNARRAFLCVKAWKVYWSYEVLSEEHFWASCSRKNKSNDWTGFSNKVSAKPYSDSTFLRRFHLETFGEMLSWKACNSVRKSNNVALNFNCNTELSTKLWKFQFKYYQLLILPSEILPTNQVITKYSAQVCQYKWVIGGC